jgi:predicted GNAT family acetyltransferase
VLRRANEADAKTATDWATEFLRQANPSDPSDPAEIVGRLLRTGGLFVWDDGAPVSMCGASGRTPHGARVGLVYTPAAQRRRGYATAAVTALTRGLLAEGNRYCCLYTDLANPTSNGIYRTIGYREVCDVNDYEFGRVDELG